MQVHVSPAPCRQCTPHLDTYYPAGVFWISRAQTPDCQLNLNLDPIQSAMTLILNVSAKHPCACHCHLKDNCFEQMSSSIQGGESTLQRVQLWDIWSEIQTKFWLLKSFFCFKRMFGRSRKRTVTPYDDITEGLKGIYRDRLLPLEKVSDDVDVDRFFLRGNLLNAQRLTFRSLWYQVIY